jgi:hypothetical protein
MSDKPTVKISNKNFKCHYYSDGSGEFEIKHKSKYFYYREDALLKHHIEDLKEEIALRKEQLSLMKSGLSTLKKIKLK